MNHARPLWGVEMETREIQLSFILKLDQNRINRLDLAIARGKWPDKKWQYILDLSSDEVIRRLPWLRRENAKGEDIYFRPEKNGTWPIFVLDDLTDDQAKLMGKYRSWIIRTSSGRHHAWIMTDRPLSPPERYQIQKYFVDRGIGDQGAVSRDRLGRIPGFRNWKRGGEWVNLIASPNSYCPLLHPTDGGMYVSSSEFRTKKFRPFLEDSNRDLKEVDRSQSGKEFGWACWWLKKGLDPEEAIQRLSLRAQERGKNRPEEYAKRTIEAARARLESVPLKQQ